MVNQDRNVFASALVKLGHADALITGMTRTFSQTLKEVRQVLDPAPGKVPFGIHLMVAKNYTVFLADTTVNERPSAEDLAHIAVETADVARRMGHEPRVAFLSFSTFGNPMGRWVEPIRGAVSILDEANPGFEYEGEVAPDAALNPKVMANYPFSRLSGPANVLIMPGLQSANISAKLLRELAGNAVIGPMLLGMEKPVQIAPMTAIAPDILTLAVLAAAAWRNSAGAGSGRSGDGLGNEAVHQRPQAVLETFLQIEHSGQERVHRGVFAIDRPAQRQRQDGGLRFQRLFAAEPALHQRRGHARGRFVAGLRERSRRSQQPGGIAMARQAAA
jgi:hypothetical protein